MLKNKKLLFTILMIALLLLIPNIVKAAGNSVISGIRITLSKPIIGHTVSTAADVSVAAIDSMPDLNPDTYYQVSSIEWWESETEDGVTYRRMEATDTFKPNLKYKVGISYNRPVSDEIPNIDGYVDSDNFYVTVNGNSINVTNTSAFNPGSSGDLQYEYDYVSYEIGKAEPEVIINTIDITVPNTGVGDKHCDSSDIVVKANGSISLNVGEAFWYMYNPNTKKYEEFTGTTLEEDSEYNVYIWFTVPYKYALSNNVVVKINGVAIDTSDEDVFDYGKAGSEFGIQARAVYHINTSDPVYYSILEGKDPTFTPGTSGALTFKIDAPLNKFMGVFIGDNEIAPKNYEVAEGSTVITLKEDYLKTLAAGKYELMFLYSDGYAISDLTIAGTGGNAGGNAGGTGSNDPTKAPGRIPYAGGTLIMILSSTLFVVAGAYAFKKTRDLKGI